MNNDEGYRSEKRQIDSRIAATGQNVGRGIKQVRIDHPCCRGSDRHDERYRKSHTDGGVEFFRNADIGANAKKTVKNEIVDKNDANKNDKVMSDIHQSAPENRLVLILAPILTEPNGSF